MRLIPMFLSYQYRIYPLRSQTPALDHYLEELTYLWNFALAERRDAWVRERRRVTYLDQQARLKAWRAYDHGGLGKVPYNVGRDMLQRLDLAFQAFFRRVKAGDKPGYPRFRRETRSFTFIPGREDWVLGPRASWRLKVPRIGLIPIRRHRPPPAGSVKSVTIHQEGESWFASLQYKVPDPPVPGAPPMHPIGVDLGLSHLATLSTGEVIEAPQLYRRAEEGPHREQRRLARKMRGSHRYARQRDRVARWHARVRRQRRWLAHQLSHDWAERFDLIAFEDLSPRPLLETGRLSKSLADAGWTMLRDMVAYKAALRSRRCVRVSARGTTQTCSTCGRKADPPMTLPDREYRCLCGYEADRDVNAARNILQRGLDEVRRSPAELRRVDGTPPPGRKGRRAYQRKREQLTDRPFGPERAQQIASGPSRPNP